MMLRTSSAAATSLACIGGSTLPVRQKGVAPLPSSVRVVKPWRACNGVAVKASSENSTLTGVVFEPFAEVQSQLVLVPETSTQSFARQRFSPACESALNEQINVEYNVSYIYHALFAYFDRDNVGLPGFAKYFKDGSDEEREHAETFMRYQNTRGGRVKLQSILMPLMEFDHAEKGDVLYAMELALSLEKLTNEKLLNLHKVAVESNDAQMTDFIESTFLGEQVEAIKKVSEYVAQLRRVGKGHGVYHFDLVLQGAAAAPGPA
eukprot:TRINITY_DN2187_c0_g1_i1.p1 TRINITY_DN2187_c0_g1~~TRINITY_DN2187_c0_g1_i1.p1  ORF type:complete len:263 (+),score=43.56 TRINITY_DN2187_c0_g1_i1:213-1001(+)